MQTAYSRDVICTLSIHVTVESFKTIRLKLYFGFRVFILKKAMTAYLLLPFRFLLFWFIEAPLNLINYFFHWNNALLHYLSVPLFLRTFFKPLKNEYRGGLVGFSLAMGMVSKSVLLVTSTGILLVALILEIGIVISFVTLPISTVLLLFL